MSKEVWEVLVRRADKLASKDSAAKELLQFYAKLLAAQKDIYDSIRNTRDREPTGSLQEDLPFIRPLLDPLLQVVKINGSAALSEDAEALLATGAEEIDAVILDHWHNPTDTNFFAKAFLQPYARWLMERGTIILDREFEQGERLCPFCGGAPQLSFLQTREASAESGNRDLLCSMCLASWPYRRVICAKCGEERPSSLGYYHTPEYDHIRVETCDTCRHYIKGVDLTRTGLAVPLVDEVAAAPLDLWARDHGYTKIELNLVGL